MSSSIPLGFGVGRVGHHEIAQGINQINALSIRVAAALIVGAAARQKREQGCRCRAHANRDQVRMLLVQKLKIAAVAVGR